MVSLRSSAVARTNRPCFAMQRRSLVEYKYFVRTSCNGTIARWQDGGCVSLHTPSSHTMDNINYVDVYDTWCKSMQRKCGYSISLEQMEGLTEAAPASSKPCSVRKLDFSASLYNECAVQYDECVLEQDDFREAVTSFLQNNSAPSSSSSSSGAAAGAVAAAAECESLSAGTAAEPSSSSAQPAGHVGSPAAEQSDARGSAADGQPQQQQQQQQEYDTVAKVAADGATSRPSLALHITRTLFAGDSELVNSYSSSIGEPKAEPSGRGGGGGGGARKQARREPNRQAPHNYQPQAGLASCGDAVNHKGVISWLAKPKSIALQEALPVPGVAPGSSSSSPRAPRDNHAQGSVAQHVDNTRNAPLMMCNFGNDICALA